MDRERYIPGDPVLHPGTGRTERYQDANGAVFSETRHDAHGNKFSTHYSLDPATRYGYTVYGGQHQPRRPRRPVPDWGPRPASPNAGRDLGARLDAATRQATGNAQPTQADGAVMAMVLILMLLVASLPLGIAYLLWRKIRTLTAPVIALGLTEPAWLLLMWAWLASGPIWPALVALLIPLGYALYARYQRQYSSPNRPRNL